MLSNAGRVSGLLSIMTSQLIPAFGTIGRDGKYYSMWYPLLSFIAVPFAALGIFASHHIHLPEAYVVGLAAIVLSTIIAAANAGATPIGLPDAWAWTNVSPG